MDSNIHLINEFFKKIEEILGKHPDFNKVQSFAGAKSDLFSDNSKELKKRLQKAEAVIKILNQEIGGESKTMSAAVLHALFGDMPEMVLNAGESLSDTHILIFEGAVKLRSLRLGKIQSDIDNYIKFALTLTPDMRSIPVRLAELVYIVRNLHNYKEGQKELIINNISVLYAPVAHRLGLYKIKTELEESVMQHQEPEMHRYIQSELKSSKLAGEKYLESFIKPIKQKLDESGFKYKVKKRTKAVSSIWKKLKRQGVGVKKVKDIYAVRIILNSPPEREKPDCWIVYSLVTDMYRPDPKRMRDWISVPRKSGYESLHATVLGPAERWVEVQIRTERMDEIAEKGPAAHWRYKEKGKDSNSKWLAHMRDAIENPDLFTEDEELSKKTKADEIFIFTPAGELKKIKKGQTVLDFAYSIHSKIGETCSGAEINGNFFPINTELKNGQTVKIITFPKQKPNSEWLKIAKSPRARTKIKRSLKIMRFPHANIGKEMIKKKLEQIGISFSEDNIKKISDYFETSHPLEVYNKFGEGKLSLTKLKPVFFEENKQETTENKELEELPKKIGKPAERGDFLILDKNLTTLEYSFGKCCNPVPGDKVFGFVTVSKGTKIHKNSCPNAKDLKTNYPYRVIKARWRPDIDTNTGFLAEYIIKGEDRDGLTAEISNTVNNQLGMKLRSISLKQLKNKRFSGKIGLKVRSKEEAKRVIIAFSEKAYIESIERS